MRPDDPELRPNEPGPQQPLHGDEEGRTPAGEPSGERRSAPDPSSRRGSSSIDFERAWRELVRVHELEEARLLRAACGLCRGRESRGAAAADGEVVPVRRAPRPDAPHPDASERRRPGAAELRVALWRRRADEAIALALADGLEPTAALRFCAAQPVVRWPAPGELARASLELEDCAAGRRLTDG